MHSTDLFKELVELDVDNVVVVIVVVDDVVEVEVEVALFLKFIIRNGFNFFLNEWF